MAVQVKLKQLEGVYAIAQVSSDSAIPEWADGDGFVSISRTDDELSVVCLEKRVPSGVTIDAGWSCFKFIGPFAFGESGVILAVIRPLSESGMGVFVVATFDGDVLLLKNVDVNPAKKLLLEAGHRFV